MASSANSQQSDETHPAWAVWVGDSRDNRVVAVTAPDEDTAREDALAEADDYDEIYGIDGRYENATPSVFEFTFRTEHVERVVVEAPTKDYAEELADGERDYRGDYKRTVHTESQRTEKDTDDGAEGGDQQNTSLDTFMEDSDGE